MVILNKFEFTFFFLWNEVIKWYTLFCNQEIFMGVDLMFLITGLFYHPPAGSGSWQIALSLK